jgi:hypothetical protein
VFDETSSSTLRDIDWNRYDFVDLGCSNGGSILQCTRRFNVERGLGIDLDERKVQRTREAGFEAVVADAREFKLDRTVRFVSIMDFFEHLPDLDTVEQVLTAAAVSARDFIFIKHPSFEGQEHAESLGMRQYWWHWRGHTAHVRVADYCSMFERLGLNQYMIRYVERITDSRHPSVIPTTMPVDVTGEQAKLVTDKPLVRFDPPLWRRQDIFIALRAFEPEEWLQITRPLPGDLKLMRESGQLPAS